MKAAFAITGAVFAIAYVLFQALCTLLQPLFNALSGKLH
jgi:hypothetical protein